MLVPGGARRVHVDRTAAYPDPMSEGYRVAVVGATGQVGTLMLDLLREREFPAREIVPFASERSVGRELAGGLVVRGLSARVDPGVRHRPVLRRRSDVG